MIRQEETRRKVSVILPTYNERENIIPLVQEIFQRVGKETELVVVDDDSPDGTWREVEKLAKSEKNLHLLRRLGIRGLVSALNDGIAVSRGEIIVWMDCDFSMPPHIIKALLGKIDQGYDIAVASRFIKGGGVEIIAESSDTFLAYIASLSLNRFIQRMLYSNFKDYTSGFIAIKKKVLENIPLKGDYGEYFIALIYRAIKMGYKVAEIPYLSKARRKGVSKTGTNIFHYLKKGIKYIILTIRLKFSNIQKMGKNEENRKN